MKLSAELLANILSNENAQIVFPQLEKDFKTIVESDCYTMLEQIQSILMADSLDDQDCFLKIEEIVCVFEEHKIRTGFRHDVS